MMPVVPHVEDPKSEEKARPRGFLGRLNKPLLAVVACLVVYGIVNLWFVTADSTEYSVNRQILGVALGVAVMLVLWKIDYQIFAPLLIPLLVIDVLLLVSPHFPIIGYASGGAQSWVNVGIRFQPGELAKLVTILMMASMVSRYQGRIDDQREYVKCLGLLLVPFACIMTQPDLGSGLVLLVTGATIIFIGGANRRFLWTTILVMTGLVAFVLLIDPVLDNLAGTDVFIKDYQMNRLLVFIDPDLDPTGVGYNLEQAMIAIGSGGLFGKGMGNATQSALGFLPEAPTDFVFCTVAEQLGFLGVLVLLVLFAALIAICIRMALRVENLYAKLIIMGVSGMWLFQVLENIGMCLGVLPITGIPLPFMSYGSSAMILNLGCVGLICSIWSIEQGRSSAVKSPKDS